MAHCAAHLLRPGARGITQRASPRGSSCEPAIRTTEGKNLRSRDAHAFTFCERCARAQAQPGPSRRMRGGTLRLACASLRVMLRCEPWKRAACRAHGSGTAVSARNRRTPRMSLRAPVFHVERLRRDAGCPRRWLTGRQAAPGTDKPDGPQRTRSGLERSESQAASVSNFFLKTSWLSACKRRAVGVWRRCMKSMKRH